MRSQGECLAKAAEMEGQARRCGATAAGAAFLRIAGGWRRVARQAAWQDAATAERDRA